MMTGQDITMYDQDTILTVHTITMFVQDIMLTTQGITILFYDVTMFDQYIMITTDDITRSDQDMLMTAQDKTMFDQDIMMTQPNNMRQTPGNNKVALCKDVCLIYNGIKTHYNTNICYHITVCIRDIISTASKMIFKARVTMKFSCDIMVFIHNTFVNCIQHNDECTGNI